MIVRDAVLKEAKHVFFAAMLAGYVGDGDGVTKTKESITGCTTIQFVRGSYKVVDYYYTTPHSDRSAGMTMIFFGGMPVWWMSYGGSYPKEVIPLLKDALGAAYVCHFFNGGRGPKAHTRIGMRYENVVEPGGNFVQFKGREEIRFDHDQAGEVLGFHEYFGGSLI